MQNSFFNYIQPTIVRASDTSRIHDSLKGQYLINMNVVGIQYFEDLFLLIQNYDGFGFEYMLTNNGEKIRLQEEVEQMDIPRIYLAITDKITKNDSAFRYFLIQALTDNSIYYNGTDDFVPGVDYWIGDTLYDYLISHESQFCEEDENRRLPNYLDSDFEVLEHWEKIPEELKYYTNFQYFQNKNWQLSHNTYTEDELDNFYSTFCGIILNQTTINSDKLIEQNNQIYNRTLNYFNNFKTDSIAAGISLILGTKYKAIEDTISSCGCSTNTSSTSLFDQYGNKSCFDMYGSAMEEYLKQMLGDTSFYKDWMYSENVEEYFPNEGMIQNLITLLEEFEAMGYDLSFRSDRPVYGNKCIGIEDSTDITNHCTIQNYIKVLKFVLNKEIDENKNKIKVYGEKFAELLPKLQF